MQRGLQLSLNWLSESEWLGQTGSWTIKHLFREIGLHWGRVYGIGALGERIPRSLLWTAWENDYRQKLKKLCSQENTSDFICGLSDRVRNTRGERVLSWETQCVSGTLMSQGKVMSFWLLDDATVWESQVLKGSSPRWRVVPGEAGDVCAPRLNSSSSQLPVQC